MGQLVDGVWQDIWYDTSSTGGRFKRSTSQFRNWVTADGQPGEHASEVLKRRKIVITCTFHLPALGRTALC